VFDINSRSWAWDALNNGTLTSADFWLAYFDDTILSKVYKALQVIPITSAATERNWSIHGAIRTKVRNRLVLFDFSLIGIHDQ
jgi:hypothetical protein